MDLFTPEEIKDIINIYNETNNVDIIIDKYNTHEYNIRYVLKEYEVDRRYGWFSDELYDRIAKMYLDGYSQKQISDVLHVSDPSIRKMLKRRNIPTRSSSECNKKYKRNKYYFDCIDSQNKAYILGLLFADGCNFYNGKHNIITIMLQEEDGYMVDRIKNELEYEGKVKIVKNNEKNQNHKNCCKLYINDEYMSARLREIGMVKAKSLILEFPTCIPMYLIRHFIRGYFDGDGCIYLNKDIAKTEACITGTYQFVSKIADIIHSMNGSCNIQHPKQCGESNTYCLRINGYNGVENFMSWIYEDADMKLERKYNTYLEIKKFFGERIKILNS